MIDDATDVGTSPWPLSVLFGGLVDPSRLSCLLALRERPRTVREILAATDLSQPKSPNTSPACPILAWYVPNAPGDSWPTVLQSPESRNLWE
jgi:hypothetical protein